MRLNKHDPSTELRLPNVVGGVCLSLILISALVAGAAFFDEFEQLPIDRGILIRDYPVLSVGHLEFVGGSRDMDTNYAIMTYRTLDPEDLVRRICVAAGEAGWTKESGPRSVTLSGPEGVWKIIWGSYEVRITGR